MRPPGAVAGPPRSELRRSQRLSFRAEPGAPLRSRRRGPGHPVPDALRRAAVVAGPISRRPACGRDRRSARHRRRISRRLGRCRAVAGVRRVVRVPRLAPGRRHRRHVRARFPDHRDRGRRHLCSADGASRPRRVPGRKPQGLCGRDAGAGLRRVAHVCPAYRPQSRHADHRPDLLVLRLRLLDLAGLSFLGFGVQPPTPDWGSMLWYAKQQVYVAPFGVIPPAVAIVLSVVGFNLVGDWFSEGESARGAR